jgi:acetyl-CoA carboxylase carboxyl transferase subunit beta
MGMDWFKVPRKAARVSEDQKHVRTEGLWIKCEGCHQIIWRKDLEETLQCCPKCNRHFRLDALTRLKTLLDGDWVEYDRDMTSSDPLGFVDAKPYHQRLAAMQKTLGMKDAVYSVEGQLAGRNVNICCLELRFIGGSMGAVVGEKITRAVERSLARRIPLIIVSASGGARMQEGAISLMQLGKISCALMRLDQAGIPFISVLTDPTTGGVTASFAMLGDLNIAEPGAQIGFAGPRVIEQTIRQKLPEGFQTAEFVLQHGFLDAVVNRSEMKSYIANALSFLCDPVGGPVSGNVAAQSQA